MCTVTYLPLSNKGFILTHNRDEHYTRQIALLPKKIIFQGLELVFPKDEQGGGTWFASSKNFSLCLLNGGKNKHDVNPPYKHSRGLVILDFFKYNDVGKFLSDYSFDGIEPFTLIVIEHINNNIHEIIKNTDSEEHTIKSNKEAHIWSSTTLYTEIERRKRSDWFTKWCNQQTHFTQDKIIEFHKSKYDETNDEGILINRNQKLYTVSLTSLLCKDHDSIHLLYEDFVTSNQILIDV